VSIDYSPIEILLVIIVVAALLLALAIIRLRDRSRLSRTRLTLWGGIGLISAMPVLVIAFFVLCYVALNFPFTSGVIAQASSPAGEQACVVQTFKGAEPYQVSLYVHRRGQPWLWHYLAHQDDRWRDCRIEFAADQIRVYTGSTLRKTFSVAEVTSSSGSAHEELPATYTPEQILAQHNARYHD